MTTLITLFLAILNLGVGSILVVLYQRVKLLQDNHIHDIIERLTRLENKLDDHISFHLEKEI